MILSYDSSKIEKENVKTPTKKSVDLFGVPVVCMEIAPFGGKNSFIDAYFLIDRTSRNCC